MPDKPKLVALMNNGLFAELFPPHVQAAYREHFILKHRPSTRTDEETIEALTGAVGCVTSWGSPRLTGHILGHTPSVRMIGHAAGSVKPIVDETTWRHDVVVINAAYAIAKYVGEMALMLTLATFRHLTQQNDVMHNDKGWRTEKWGRTDTLFGKTVGLIGFGATGREFAKLLRAFNTRVLVYDPYMREETARTYGVVVTPLEPLLQQADVVSLHVPKTPDTHRILSKSRLELMRDDAVLVNTSSGAAIDEDALVGELRSGRLRAALDVYEKEPLPPDHPFRHLPNCTLTPHQSGPVVTRRWEMAAYLVEPFLQYIVHGQVPAGAIGEKDLEILA